MVQARETASRRSRCEMVRPEQLQVAARSSLHTRREARCVTRTAEHESLRTSGDELGGGNIRG